METRWDGSAPMRAKYWLNERSTLYYSKLFGNKTQQYFFIRGKLSVFLEDASVMIYSSKI